MFARCTVASKGYDVTRKDSRQGVSSLIIETVGCAQQMILIPITVNRINLLLSPTAGSDFNLSRGACHAFLHIARSCARFFIKTNIHIVEVLGDGHAGTEQEINGKSCQLARVYLPRVRGRRCGQGQTSYPIETNTMFHPQLVSFTTIRIG